LDDEQVPTIFAGFEVGRAVRTGAALETCAPRESPCRQALMDFRRDNPGAWGPGGRMSFDPITTLVAVRGVVRTVGVAECTGCDGHNAVRAGRNEWVAGARTNESYLVLTDNATIGKAIDDLLCRPPTPSPAPAASDHWAVLVAGSSGYENYRHQVH